MTDGSAAGLSEVRLGDHVAHLAASPEERAAAAAELLAAAMGRGERALGLGGEAAIDALASALAARGVDVATALARGALQLLPSHEQFLPGGAFDPDRVIRSWGARTEAALSAGFSGLVTASDMDWALSGAPGAGRLLEYEAAQGLTFGRHLAGMCQFDATRFAAPLRRGVLETHALLFHGGQLLRNPLAGTPSAVGAAEGDEAEVARLLEALHAHGEAEWAVRHGAARIRRLAGQVQYVVFRYRLSPEEGLEYVSPSVTALTGYTPEEHYADPQLHLRIVDREDGARLLAHALGQVPDPVRLRWRHRDGAEVWVEIEHRAVRDEAGTPVAIQGIARDVTERVEAEEALRRAERSAHLGRLAVEVAREPDDPLAWVGPKVRLAEAALAELEAKGRAEGLDELREALAEVARGVGRVRALVGEPGPAPAQAPGDPGAAGAATDRGAPGDAPITRKR